MQAICNSQNWKIRKRDHFKHKLQKNSFPNTLLKIACAGKTDILKSFSTSEGGGQEELPYPTPEIRGGGQEEQSHVQGAAAAWVQEDQEELFHVQGQEGQPWGDTLHPK